MIKIFKSDPVIAILTATDNAEKTICQYISSYIKTSKDLKWYVADNLSKDKTYEYIRDVATAIIRREDDGIYDAINSLIINYSFDYYMVLGADDTLLPNAYEILKNTIVNDDWPDIILFPVIINDVIKKPYYTKKNIQLSHHSCGMLIKKSIHFKIGLYDTMFKICADEHFFRKAERNKKIKIVIAQDPVGIYGEYGLSSKIDWRIIREKFVVEFTVQNIYIYSSMRFVFRLLKLLAFRVF
jgi:glycosyltransferase involved in cell wall biosynthesis